MATYTVDRINRIHQKLGLTHSTDLVFRTGAIQLYLWDYERLAALPKGGDLSAGERVTRLERALFPEEFFQFPAGCPCDYCNAHRRDMAVSSGAYSFWLGEFS